MAAPSRSEFRGLGEFCRHISSDDTLRPRTVLGTGKGETSMLDLYFEYKGFCGGFEAARLVARWTASPHN